MDDSIEVTFEKIFPTFEIIEEWPPKCPNRRRKKRLRKESDDEAVTVTYSHIPNPALEIIEPVVQSVEEKVVEDNVSEEVPEDSIVEVHPDDTLEDVVVENRVEVPPSVKSEDRESPEIIVEPVPVRSIEVIDLDTSASAPETSKCDIPQKEVKQEIKQESDAESTVTGSTPQVKQEFSSVKSEPIEMETCSALETESESIAAEKEPPKMNRSPPKKISTWYRSHRSNQQRFYYLRNQWNPWHYQSQQYQYWNQNVNQTLQFINGRQNHYRPRVRNVKSSEPCPPSNIQPVAKVEEAPTIKKEPDVKPEPPDVKSEPGLPVAPASIKQEPGSPVTVAVKHEPIEIPSVAVKKEPVEETLTK